MILLRAGGMSQAPETARDFRHRDSFKARVRSRIPWSSDLLRIRNEGQYRYEWNWRDFAGLGEIHPALRQRRRKSSGAGAPGSGPGDDGYRFLLKNEGPQKTSIPA